MSTFFIGGRVSPALRNSSFDWPRLYDGYTSTWNLQVPSAHSNNATAGTLPFIQVQLDQTYTDVELVSVWASDSSFLTTAESHVYWGQNLTVWVSETSDYSAGFKCAERLQLVATVETLAYCNYTGPVAYVTVVRHPTVWQPASIIALQELRVWRGGET